MSRIVQQEEEARRCNDTALRMEIRGLKQRLRGQTRLGVVMQRVDKYVHALHATLAARDHSLLKLKDELSSIQGMHQTNEARGARVAKTEADLKEREARIAQTEAELEARAGKTEADLKEHEAYAN